MNNPPPNLNYYNQSMQNVPTNYNIQNNFQHRTPVQNSNRNLNYMHNNQRFFQDNYVPINRPNYNYQSSNLSYQRTNLTCNNYKNDNFKKELQFIIDNYEHESLPQNEDKRNISESLKDEFFQNNPNAKIPRKQRGISIPEFRTKLENIEKLNDKLKDKIKNGLLEEGKLLQEEIQQYKSEITPELIEKVKSKISKIKSKRKRIKNVKIKMHEKRREDKTSRKAIHEDIDEKIQNIQNKDDNKKKNKALKQSTDKVLSSVISNIQDVNSSLETLNILQELRDRNKISDLSKGIICTVGEDNNFLKKLNYMKDLCNKQLVLYENQKGMLEMLIEKERRHDIDTKQEQIFNNKLAEIKQVLFGKEVIPQSDSEIRIQEFINTRREWDLYLSTGAEDISLRVPLHYVLPSQPNDDVWRKYYIES